MLISHSNWVCWSSELSYLVCKFFELCMTCSYHIVEVKNSWAFLFYFFFSNFVTLAMKMKMIMEWHGICASHRIFGKPIFVTRRIKFKNRPQPSGFLEESLQGKLSGWSITKKFPVTRKHVWFNLPFKFPLWVEIFAKEFHVCQKV